MRIDLKNLIKKNKFDNALLLPPRNGEAKRYYILPVAKPRMTRSDKWKKRDCVMRYRDFCDEARSLRLNFNSGDHITFVLPMPESWSVKKRKQTNGEPHRIKPDLDNLIKAVCDALYENDSAIWDFRATKIWGERGEIIIKSIAEKI